MCQLATAFCNFMLQANIGGVVRNLRDEPDGHHAFVYGNVDAFPAHIESYFVAADVPDAANYRQRALEARKENLANARRYEHFGYVGNLRHSEAQFVESRADSVIPDPHASAEEWTTAMRQLTARRIKWSLEKMRSKQPPKFSHSERRVLETLCPRHWAEYSQAIAALSAPRTGRRKHVARANRTAREHVKFKGRALYTALRQHGYEALYVCHGPIVPEMKMTA